MRYFEEYETIYISRTAEYYDEEQDWLFTPPMWTYGWTPTEKRFAGAVYQLTDEGKRILGWWLECRSMNEYQRKHCWGYDNTSSEELFEKLTTDKDYSELWKR